MPMQSSKISLIRILIRIQNWCLTPLWLVWLAGCTVVAADYQKPIAAIPMQWESPLPHGGKSQSLQTWWEQFHDPVLIALQQSAEADSPTLAAAWGAIEQARATLSSAGAGGRPKGTFSAMPTRSNQQNVPATTQTTTVDASWEIDLFGKVQRKQESAQAQLQARQNDWHDARISLAAEVATRYVEYRACVQLAALYTQELESIQHTARATDALVKAGLSPSTDAALAQATQASSESTLLEQQAQCDLLVKSLTNLTGQAESKVRSLLGNGLVNVSAVPSAPNLLMTNVPAAWVRQRPDIASRERDMAAASASIGVAQADLYPSIQLSGSVGASTTNGTPFTNWSFGPSISLPIFDGGTRKAAVENARANLEIAYAQWRNAVRNAVTEVEQALVQLQKTSQRLEHAQQAAQEYARYQVGADAQWRAGTISLLTLEESRRQSLTAQLDVITLQRDRVTYGITLYKAIGGGWSADAPNATITPPLSRASQDLGNFGD